MPAAKGPRPRTLIFHIGDHKAGSTSIQMAFAQQQVHVEGHKIFYPADLNMNGIKAHISRYCQPPNPIAKTKAASHFKALAKRIRTSEADFAIISGETMEFVAPADLKSLIDTFFSDCADEIRVISYVRPHPGRITSSFAERIKVGAQNTLDHTLVRFAQQRKKSGTFLYMPRFQSWRDCFGEQFILRPVVRSHLHLGSVTDDFCHHAFNGLPYSLATGNKANESLHLEDLMRLKVLQKALNLTASHHLNIGWEVARQLALLPSGQPQEKLQLHRSLAETIRKTYLTDAKAVDKAFFDGVPILEDELQLAVDKAIPDPQSTDPRDHLSASEIRSLELMAGTISSLMQYPEANWIDFLRKQRVPPLTDIADPERSSHLS